MATVIELNDAVIFSKMGELMTPVIALTHQAIREEERRAFPSDLIVDLRSIPGREEAA